MTGCALAGCTNHATHFMVLRRPAITDRLQVCDDHRRQFDLYRDLRREGRKWHPMEFRPISEGTQQ